jgi:hypothetical protein
LLGRTVAEAVPEVIDQGYIRVLDKVFQTGTTFVAERVLVHLGRQDTGQMEEVYLTFTYQALYEGEAIMGILVFGYEVTEEVKYRQKLVELGISVNG